MPLHDPFGIGEQGQADPTLDMKSHVSHFPIDAVRAKFPSLARAAPFIFFDNAAGSDQTRPSFGV